MESLSHWNLKNIKPPFEQQDCSRLCPNLPLATLHGRKSFSLQTVSSVMIPAITLSIPFMDYFILISLSDPPSNPCLLVPPLAWFTLMCAVRVRSAYAAKSSVTYEVIAGIIGIINQRFSRGAGGELKQRRVGGEIYFVEPMVTSYNYSHTHTHTQTITWYEQINIFSQKME